MRNSKRVLSKAQILDRVWSYDCGGRSNIVELYVSYLRKKIDSWAQADDPHIARRWLCPQARALRQRGTAGLGHALGRRGAGRSGPSCWPPR